MVTSYLPPVEDTLIGKTLADRYYIVKKLGEGGMGAVYLATHRLLEKSVALKVLHGEFARKPDLVERFMQEAKSASRIRHENVIDISDFGVTPDGQVFFAMELLKGHDLHEEIAKARNAGELLPWSRSRPIFLQICAALNAAHGHGIIHRDLKPENIYLVDFLDQPDFVKLLDFGIAKMTEVSEGDRKLTRTGMLFGTPEYMSPEQARGETADVRVDVYAMACILFQLVTGRVPFEADNFMSVLTLHLMEPPPTVPAATLNAIGAPVELAAIINKGLAKDRNERWQTIVEFANAIRALHGEEALPGHNVNRVTGVRASVAMPAQADAGKKAGKDERWTGSVRVPDEENDPAAGPRKSKAPLIAAALLVLGAGGAGAYFATRPKATDGNGSTVASGSAPAIASGAVPADAAPATPDSATVVAVQPPAIPARVKVTVVTVPKGAKIFDEKNVQVLGITPGEANMAGDGAPRVLVAKLKGFKDYAFEVARDRDDTYTITLERGTGKSTGVAGVTHNGGSNGSASGSNATTPMNGSGAGAGSAMTVKDPVVPPPPTPDAAPSKPVEKDPHPNQVIDDPDLPGPLKNMPSVGSGSSS